MYRNSIAVLVALCVMAVSCNKASTVSVVGVDSKSEKTTLGLVEEPIFTSDHDLMLSQMAKLVNIAVRENSGMRSFIHSETLKRFDGDYEFLISDAMDKPVNMTTTKAISESDDDAVTFRALLQNYLPETKSGITLLDELQEQYPDLQVAVPIHAQEWDPETYIPAGGIISVPTGIMGTASQMH